MIDRSLLKTILEASTQGLLAGVRKTLEKELTSPVIFDGDNYIIAHGSNPIALVCHLDTVRKKADFPVDLEECGDIIRNKKGVLGADDRAGVYSLIHLMRVCKKKDIPMPTLIFTNYEECGGKGVKALIKDKVLNTEGIKLFLEFDRKGCNDFVYYYNPMPLAVSDYLESFGFVKAFGSYSDITDLCETYKIPGVNLSVGYYDQHTSRETLHVDELELTLTRSVKMLKSPIAELHTLQARTYSTYGKGSRWDWDREDYYRDTEWDPVGKCWVKKQAKGGGNVVNITSATSKKEPMDDEYQVVKSCMHLIKDVLKDGKDIMEVISICKSDDAKVMKLILELLVDIEGVYNYYYEQQIKEKVDKVEAHENAFAVAWNICIEDSGNKTAATH